MLMEAFPMRALMTVIPTILWCGCSVAVDMTAEEILDNSEAAYVALRSYEGTTTVNSTIDTGSQKCEQTATAKITFARPGKIRIEGKTARSNPYAIVSDGKGTCLAFEGNGAFRKTKVESAIARMTGVALKAPAIVPSALLKLEWKYPFDAGIKSTAEFVGREMVGDNECYKIVIKSPMQNSTYWIDTKTFLLRQLKEELSKSARAALSAPEVGVGSMVSVHTFTIDRVNTTVAEENFAASTEK